MKIDSIIPFKIQNENDLEQRQIQFVYSVVNDDGLAWLQNLDNSVAAKGLYKVDPEQLDINNIPVDELKWVKMSEAEALEYFKKERRRNCKLAINGYHIRKNNLSGWQKELEEALEINGDDYWISPKIEQACNYKQAWVETPKTSLRTKDMQFLLRWCIGLQKRIKQETKKGDTTQIQKLLEAGCIEQSPYKDEATGAPYYFPTDKFSRDNIKNALDVKGNISWEKLASYNAIIPKPYGYQNKDTYKPKLMDNRQLMAMANNARNRKPN